ncbi:MAG TPA: N-acetylmuramidase family protein [Flavisolibacter sp.]|nr:N-acetylmuramidase family protein [Flavisolibacter sp.]
MNAQDWISAAQTLGCSVAAIKAVAEVEGGGVGFSSVNGHVQPIILFEPHVFWRELKKRGIDPAKHTAGNGDILYEKWGTRPYPSGQVLRYAQLDKAARINRDAALCSASWGKFQIMGYHWQSCGCVSLQDFINAMYRDEASHLRCFVHLVKSWGLADELKRKDWTAFARAYNGASYAVHGYHRKLAAAYDKYALQR